MSGDAPVVLDAKAIAPVLFERIDVELHPDARRVIVRLFLPDEQILPDDGLLARILALPESDVAGILNAARAKFEDRHVNLEAVLDSHFQYVTRSTTGCAELSKERQLLIGAYYTQEGAREDAAPSCSPTTTAIGIGCGQSSCGLNSPASLATRSHV